MNIQSEKKKLIEWILGLKDESVIEEIKALKENSLNGSDWWDELSEEEIKSIEEGLKDVEEGRVVSYEQVKEDMKKWLTKLKSPDKK